MQPQPELARGEFLLWIILRLVALVEEIVVQIFDDTSKLLLREHLHRGRATVKPATQQAGLEPKHLEPEWVQEGRSVVEK